MNIKVWDNFSKRENSTKQPTSGTTIDVNLKGPCSLHNPVFIVSNPVGKYTYVEAFGEYYFVDDVINLNASMCEIHCRKDPMATYKSEIGSTTAFILYDTTSNTEVVDERLSQETTPSLSKNEMALASFFSSSGSIIATVTGPNSTQSYVISSGDLKNLFPDIRSQVQDFFPTMTGVLDTDLVPAIVQAVFQIIGAGSVAENIRDVRWVPFTVSGGSSTRIYAGIYDTSRNGNPVRLTGTDRILRESSSINIPWQFSDWRNSEPYTQLYAWLPYVGLINIPASSLKGHSSLLVTCCADVISGDISIALASQGTIIGTYGASTAVQIPVGNVTMPTSTLFTAISAIPSMIAGGPAGILMGTSRAIAGFTPISQSVGGISSASGTGLGFNMRLFTICHDTNVSPSSVSASMGTPAMAQKQISTLSGYVQCQNASVDISADASDREIINNYLNTGFFYE